MSDLQLSDLGALNRDFLVHGVSGFGRSEVLSDRPYGGCAILWNKHVACKVTPIIVQSRRIAVIKVELPTYSLLLLNIYIYIKLCHVKMVQLKRVMNLRRSYLLSNHYLVLIVIVALLLEEILMSILLVNRGNVLFRNFLHNCDFICSQLLPNVQLDFTYHFNMDKFSVIDHFVVPRDFTTMIKQVSILHNVRS